MYRRKNSDEILFFNGNFFLGIVLTAGAGISQENNLNTFPPSGMKGEIQ